MQWKLIHAYFEETYWPKIKTWDNELFVREGRTKVTIFNPIRGAVIICPKRRYDKVHRKDITDTKALKHWKKFFNEQRQRSKKEQTSSYYGRWTSTNAKNIYKYLNEKLRAD